MHFAEKFLLDQKGAVTMDWVVLSGIVITFAVGVAIIQSNGSLEIAVGQIARELIINTNH